MNISDDKQYDDEDLARLLKAAGRREEIPATLKQQWEQTLRAELAPVIARRQLRRNWLLGSAAACLVMVISGLLFNPFKPAVAPPTMEIAQNSGESWVFEATGERLAAVAGASLAAENILATATDARLALRWGAHDIRLNENSRIQVFAAHVVLLQGEIYVNSEASTASSGSIAIETPFATIRDIGTQFTVRLQNDRVVSTVRKGSIVVSTDTFEQRADAGVHEAQQLTVDAAQHFSSRALEVDWAWIYAVSPTFSTGGSTVYDFLQWSVHETGLELSFESEAAEISSRVTYLNDTDISSLNPSLAVHAVLASTGFEAERGRGHILFIKSRKAGGHPTSKD